MVFLKRIGISPRFLRLPESENNSTISIRDELNLINLNFPRISESDNSSLFLARLTGLPGSGNTSNNSFLSINLVPLRDGVISSNSSVTSNIVRSPVYLDENTPISPHLVRLPESRDTSLESIGLDPNIVEPRLVALPESPSINRSNSPVRDALLELNSSRPSTPSIVIPETSVKIAEAIISIAENV